MELLRAEALATKAQHWILPYCQKAWIAGSIRRRRPQVNDIDIVCVPNRCERTDLFGEVIESKNVLFAFLRIHVRAVDSKMRFVSGGEAEGKQVIIQLIKADFQLDLWFATESNFATRFLCRTGSKEHNIWLAARFKRMGMHWNPYEGVYGQGSWEGDAYVGGILQTTPTEMDIYRLADLDLIPVEQRETSKLQE